MTLHRFIYILLLALPVIGINAQQANDTTAVYGADTAAVAADTAAAPQETLPSVEYTHQRRTYEIAGIKVSGADSYEDFVLIGFSGLAVGDKVEIPGDQITKSIRRFWKQGLFSNVQILATRMTDTQVWLEIRLEERPRISELEYRGMKKSEREDLEVKVGITKGNQMTPNLADRAKKVISQYYAEKASKTPK